MSRNGRQLVILTGLSGSGKGSVLKTFEDLGFYCVDNLPVGLIPTFSELHMHSGGDIQRAALLVDAREGGELEKLPGILRQLRGEIPATLVFIEANEDALLRRFSETRRPHPLGHDRPVLDGRGAEVGQLGVALGQDHAERAQAAHRQEPAGRRHVRGGGAAQHSEEEAGRHE